MKKVYHLTKVGKADLEKELKELIDSRSAIADEIATARENGDLSENSEYTAAREKQGRTENRIAEIQEILDGAQIIESDDVGKVSLGDTVTVEVSGKEKTYTVVGAIEADPMANRISNESPLGAALLGAKAGDTVKAQTPKGEKEYKVVKVN